MTWNGSYNGKALVVLSGGQDSVTCLAWAMARFPHGVAAVTFDYGQRHRVEIECAAFATDHYSVDHHFVSLEHLSQVSRSALTHAGNVSGTHELDSTLPASFVPNRNATMLTAAHALAQRVGASHLVAGMCQTDYSGYPDCRANFVTALSHALNIGAAKKVSIHTPLMFLSKGETFKLAADLGALDLVLEHSHTCYNGDHTTRHPWGYGCGTCPACRLREGGWHDYEAMVK